MVTPGFDSLAPTQGVTRHHQGMVRHGPSLRGEVKYHQGEGYQGPDPGSTPGHPRLTGPVPASLGGALQNRAAHGQGMAPQGQARQGVTGRG